MEHQGPSYQSFNISLLLCNHERDSTTPENISVSDSLPGIRAFVGKRDCPLEREELHPLKQKPNLNS